MISPIQTKLMEFICRNYMVEETEVDLEKSLVDQGIIDSFGLIEISSFIQKEFDIPVLENEMNRANFGSVTRLVSFVERKKLP
jgi:acyl carrier protein